MRNRFARSSLPLIKRAKSKDFLIEALWTFLIDEPAAGRPLIVAGARVEQSSHPAHILVDR